MASAEIIIVDQYVNIKLTMTEAAYLKSAMQNFQGGHAEDELQWERKVRETIWTSLNDAGVERL